MARQIQVVVTCDLTGDVFPEGKGHENEQFTWVDGKTYELDLSNEAFAKLDQFKVGDVLRASRPPTPKAEEARVKRALQAVRGEPRKADEPPVLAEDPEPEPKPKAAAKAAKSGQPKRQVTARLMYRSDGRLNIPKAIHEEFFAHPDGPPAMQCPICGIKAKDVNSLTVHTNVRHDQRLPDLTAAKLAEQGRLPERPE